MAYDVFNQMAGAAVKHMAALCGTTFQMSGDASTVIRRGVLDRHKARSKSEDGGIGIDADAVLVARLDEFAPDGLPKAGKKLSCGSHRYVVVAVEHDDAAATVYLNGLNQ